MLLLSSSGIRVVMMKSFNVKGTGIQKLYKLYKVLYNSIHVCIAIYLILQEYAKYSFIKSFINDYCGAKRSGDPNPFRIKPKAHAEEEEMSEDEQRESRLPGYTAKDDPVLGKLKSQKGKAPRRQRQSPRASQRKFRAQWASHRSMVEKQFHEKLSPSY